MTSVPPTKRRRLSHNAQKDHSSDSEITADNASSSHEPDLSEEEEDSVDTDDEIANAQAQKSRQTPKRKLRATRSDKFGATLQSLLDTDAPSSLPLSLKPSVARKRNDEKLEVKARKVLRQQKKESEDKRRIVDVIGGWGGESERTLRKVAQRGVVKLFNVIQQSQASSLAAAEEAKAARGSGKPTLAAPTIEVSTKSKGKIKARNKDNIIGRDKPVPAGQNEFLDMIRSGGIISRV